MPSSAKRSATGRRRSPSRETSVTSAPIAHSTGAVSEEETAQHLLDPGATQHTSPSRFRQKPMERRHSWVWFQ